MTLCRGSQTLLLAVSLLLGVGSLPLTAQTSSSGALIDTFPFPGIAPQGITRDDTDGTYWVTSFLDPVITHFAPDGTPIGTIPSPFPPSARPTGIAYYPLNDSLLVLDGLTDQLVEIDKTGALSGLNFNLPVDPVPNLNGPLVRGLAVHMAGGSGIGSIYVVESVATKIYEIDLNGFVIRDFIHPQDPDGFPGQGAAAEAGGIELILDPLGQIEFIDVIGGDGGVAEVLRLLPDGTPTGFEISLIETGAGIGGIGGIIRDVVIDPMSGLPVDAIIGTSESTAALFIVDGSLPTIAQINDLECVSTDDEISLTWTPGPGYDAIDVFRNDSLVTTLGGAANAFLDTALADGVYEYRVIGRTMLESSDPVECSGVVGAGQVLDSVELTAVQFGLDITEGGGFLWVTTNEGVIQRYTTSLVFDGDIPAPFTGMDDEPAAIAFRPEANTLLVVNAFDNMMQEIDLLGTPVGAPVLLAIDVPDDDPTYLGAIAYDPNGNNGLGEIWGVDSTRSIVYRMSRDGFVLDSFTHPDELFEPTPDPSFIDTFSLGISGVPDIGGGFDVLHLAGGTVFDRRMTRVIAVDPADGTPLGYQTPLDGSQAIRSTRYYGLIESTFLGEPVSFALAIRSFQTRIDRLRRVPPPVLPVTYLRCVQPDLVDRTELTFLNHGPYDVITIERDGQVIATLPGNATAYTDTTVAPGEHTYRVIPESAGVTAAPRVCSLRVGIGARLRHDFIDPAFSPYQLTRDPSDGSFVVSSNSGTAGEFLYRFADDGTFLGVIPSPDPLPRLVAALAVRPTMSGSEIWSITWEQTPTPGLPQTFRLYSQNTAGTILSGPTTVTIPGQPLGVALTYPTGMVYDEVTDTFWFLERNTDMFLQMNTSGQIIDSFPHPMPPLQQFVFNLGAAFDPVRRAFTATTAGPFETEVTQAIEFSESGIATNTAIPLDETRLNPNYGIARAGSVLFVAGSTGSIPTLVTLKAADPVEPPLDFTCEESQANVVSLNWTNPVSYDELVLRRGGVEIAVLPGTATDFTDIGVGDGERAYSLAGRINGDGTSAESLCSVLVTGLSPSFVRGDANDDGTVNLADPIRILDVLFTGGDPFVCEDAADANDSGGIDVADPIFLLTFLFQSGPQPPDPYPLPDVDPTGDLIGC